VYWPDCLITVIALISLQLRPRRLSFEKHFPSSRKLVTRLSISFFLVSVYRSLPVNLPAFVLFNGLSTEPIQSFLCSNLNVAVPTYPISKMISMPEMPTRNLKDSGNTADMKVTELKLQSDLALLHYQTYNWFILECSCLSICLGLRIDLNGADVSVPMAITPTVLTVGQNREMYLDYQVSASHLPPSRCYVLPWGQYYGQLNVQRAFRKFCG
jgi:hypothetical protein